jgi:hypothetical protein
MALPRQVEAQLKELEAIEKQLSEANAAPPEPTAEAEPAEPKQEPVQETTPEPQQVEPKPVEPVVAEDTWQQKYRTLKGMYDAEVPRLHAQVKELTHRLDAMQKAAEAPKPEPKPAAPQKLVTDEDVQAFGEDLIEVQRKVAREVAMEFRKDIEDLRAENEKLRQQMTDTGTRVSESTFEQRLHRLVPDFEQVNTDDRWVNWLNEIDPLLRGPRKSIAQEAFNRGDAEGVAHYVSLFKQSIAPVDAPKAKNAELERQVQPSKSVAAAPTASPKGRIYTDSDIQKMFKRAVDLGASGKHEEARKLEAEIDAAYNEGRVTA